MMERVETFTRGIRGEESLLDKITLRKARSNFIMQYADDPTILRLSPKAFNDFRAAAERYDLNFPYEVIVDRDFEENQWHLGREETKVYAV